MQALRGLALLLVFQTLGELLSRGLALPFPGPVVGLFVLLVALRYKAVSGPVSVCADFLLAHLSLLFVPVGVGVVVHLGLLAQYGWRMLAVLLASTVIGLVVTALCMKHLIAAHD